MRRAGRVGGRLPRVAQMTGLPRSKTDAALTSLIRQIRDRPSGNPGVRRVHAELAAMAGKWVWRLMRAGGLGDTTQGRGRKPRSTATLRWAPRT